MTAHLKQSVAWWCIVPHAMTPQDFVLTLVEVGYAGVDLVPQEYWPLVKEHGLSIAAIGGHDSILRGLNEHENYARIEREIRANLALAEGWGIPNLICFSGSRGNEDDAMGAEITAEGLRRVAGAAEVAGVTLVMELLNSKVDHPDYACDHTEWGARVCEMVDSPNVKLLYDIYHMQIMEGDIIRTIQTCHPLFGHYHTAGNPGRNELDETQELNYPAILRAIQATEYNGYVGQEFIPRGDPAAALRTAFDICNLPN